MAGAISKGHFASGWISGAGGNSPAGAWADAGAFTAAILCRYGVLSADRWGDFVGVLPGRKMKGLIVIDGQVSKTIHDAGGLKR